MLIVSKWFEVMLALVGLGQLGLQLRA